MTDKKMMDLMRQVDFSRETDFKQRLHDRLFGGKVVTLPRRSGRKALTDDDFLSMVTAAGDPTAARQEKKDHTDR